MEITYAYQGIEKRQPFYDRKLIELTLSIPWFIRIHHQGRIKSLLQDAVSELLPKSILDRNNKSTFDPFFIEVLQSYLLYHSKLSIIDDGKINKYVDKDLAFALYPENNFQKKQLWSQVYQIWAISTLRQWLHNFNQYDNKGN